MTQGPIPPIPPIPPDPNLLWMSPDGPKMVVMIVLAALTAMVIVLWPLMRAFGRRMEQKSGADPSLRSEVEQLHQRLAELEPMQARVAELEERLDFAERLLAQGKESARLGAAPDGSGR